MSHGVEIVRKNFRVRLDADSSVIWFDLPSFSQPLRMETSVDTLEAFDRSLSMEWDGRVQQCNGYERLSWTATSTLWRKDYFLDIFDNYALFHADIYGEGQIDSIRYFGAIPNEGFQEHLALIKHFNDKGYTSATEYSRGSDTAFRKVFCPEPNSYSRQYFSGHDYAQISVNSDLDYHGGNFATNPTSLCFAASADVGEEWLGMGLAVEPGKYQFSEFEYLGGAEFSLNLNCWGIPRVNGCYQTPKIVLIPGTSPDDTLTKYVEALVQRGLVQRPRHEHQDWWTRPLVCGWGHQSYQADLFRVRSTKERQPDNAAYTLCTQTNYRDIVNRLEDEHVPWGTLVIDARWFLAGGLKNVDVGRWPDLRGFVDDIHRRDKKVLLWWGPWDPEGVPEGECVRYLPTESLSRPNRPGRVAKWGAPYIGKKLTVDVSLPEVRERITSQIRTLLGSGSGCLNVDGFKVDHLGAAPGYYGIAFPEGSSELFGIEAAREMHSLIYQSAKEAKPDALIVGTAPNAYFADTMDMLRLGDIYSPEPESVVAEMDFRARMARIADPGWLIDTDGWPMPSLKAFREYVDVQPDIGVPSLYYTTHLDTTGEALTSEDYGRIRRAWSAS